MCNVEVGDKIGGTHAMGLVVKGRWLQFSHLPLNIHSRVEESWCASDAREQAGFSQVTSW